MSLVIRPERTMPPQVEAPQSSIPMTVENVWMIAEQVAASKLFATATPAQAFTLMMLCHAEGIHPIQAMRRYHIIQGRPTMRTDAIQGEMQARGWLIRPLVVTAHEASASFAHSAKMPEPLTISVTIDQFKHLAAKDNWRNHPDDMLWARLMGKACRRLDPGIIAGIYSDDEVQDMVWTESPEGVMEKASEVLRRSEAELPGQSDRGLDTRAYPELAREAAEKLGVKPADVHRHMMNAATQAGRYNGPAPATVADAVKVLARVYKDHRPWFREALEHFVASHGADANMNGDVVDVEVEATAPAEAPTAREEYGPGADG